MADDSGFSAFAPEQLAVVILEPDRQEIILVEELSRHYCLHITA
jgi:hypothetical protein